MSSRRCSPVLSVQASAASTRIVSCTTTLSPGATTPLAGDIRIHDCGDIGVSTKSLGAPYNQTLQAFVSSSLGIKLKWAGMSWLTFWMVQATVVGCLYVTSPKSNCRPLGT
jgi:hypothetical protein